MLRNPCMQRSCATYVLFASLTVVTCGCESPKAPSRSEPARVPAPEPVSSASPCGPDMIHIPPGAFTMGAGRGADSPTAAVKLGGFCIDAREVTVGEYAECVKAGSCDEPRPGPACRWTNEQRAYPVACVRLADARAYCAFRAKRLPTEEEWEFAARGTDARPFPWGQAPPDRQACWNRGEPCEAGSMREDRSPFGVLDMGGSVSEITAGKYCPYGAAPKDCPPWSPVVVRGGSFASRDPVAMHAAFRDDFQFDESSPNTGFRCAGGAPTSPQRTYDPDDATMCQCFMKVHGASSCEVEESRSIGESNPDCIRTYADDCAMMLGCSRGEPSALPTCLPGFKNFGAGSACGKACTRDTECGNDEVCRQDFDGVCGPAP